MNPVVHFEMPADDRKRMSDFYSKAFGWKTQQLGPEMGDYVLATTAETDEKGMLRKPGAINGGFYQRTDDKMSQCPSVVISVDIQKVEEAGGKILGKQMDIPGVGLYISFSDTEGNRVGMLEPAPMM